MSDRELRSWLRKIVNLLEMAAKKEDIRLCILVREKIAKTKKERLSLQNITVER